MEESRSKEVSVEVLNRLLSWAAAGLEVVAGQVGELRGEEREEAGRLLEELKAIVDRNIKAN